MHAAKCSNIGCWQKKEDLGMCVYKINEEMLLLMTEVTKLKNLEAPYQIFMFSKY